MKRFVKKAVVLLVSAALLGSVSACTGRDRDVVERVAEVENREPVKHVDLLDDDSLMERYFNAVEDFERVQYEQIVFTSDFDIGPHEYRFRGVVYLTQDEADRLQNAYEWEEVTDPEFEFDLVDISGAGDAPWYRCRQFEKDNYSLIVPYYTYFNGENLVFDIHQT